MASIPRRRVAELATIWELEKIPHVVVEGPRDARFVRLLQREEHCGASLKLLGVIPVDAIELPVDLLVAHGLNSTGARQRVIACIREAGAQKVEAGFRGIIDADIDLLKGDNFSSDCIWYTDYGCMDAYCWSPPVLRRLAIQTKCDETIRTPPQVNGLFKSINFACSVMASIRYAAVQNKEWKLDIHQSTKALRMNGGAVTMDAAIYLSQCGMKKEHSIEAVKAVAKYCTDFKAIEPKLTLNSHDLFWVLEFALRSMTTGPKGRVTEDVIADAFMAHGLSDPAVCQERLFVALGEWAQAAK